MMYASAAARASAFLSSWVSRFHIPNHITSNRDTTFTLQLWTSLNRFLCTHLHHTTAYHPKFNGMIERLHRTLKAALLSRCNFSTWYSQLPRVLLGLRTMPKKGLDLSVTELAHGNPLMIPGAFFPYNNTSPDIIRLQTIIGKFAQYCPSCRLNDKTFIPKDLNATYVLIKTNAVRPSLTQPYTGSRVKFPRAGRHLVNPQGGVLSQHSQAVSNAASDRTSPTPDNMSPNLVILTTLPMATNQVSSVVLTAKENVGWGGGKERRGEEEVRDLELLPSTPRSPVNFNMTNEHFHITLLQVAWPLSVAE
ncbi:uncharacterized protein LOC135206315 [Macrobrachium nipponense]|uniref:uncharacterized protein LOC135206315 n=1 Tax=Macrobrachium nipponense TaxID=159736 RepID=UPI0030C7E95E